jgi:hypothetical protein
MYARRAGSSADGPGVEERKIPEDKNFALRRFNFKIICYRRARIDTAFIPAVDYPLHFPAASLIGKGRGPFIGLIAAVAFHLYPFIGCGDDVSLLCLSRHGIF